MSKKGIADRSDDTNSAPNFPDIALALSEAEQMDSSSQARPAGTLMSPSSAGAAPPSASGGRGSPGPLLSPSSRRQDDEQLLGAQITSSPKSSSLKSTLPAASPAASPDNSGSSTVVLHAFQTPGPSSSGLPKLAPLAPLHTHHHGSASLTLALPALHPELAHSTTAPPSSGAAGHARSGSKVPPIDTGGSRPSSRPTSAHHTTQGSTGGHLRLGAGPGPSDLDGGLHSYRGSRAGPIPLTGGSIAQSSGVGAVNLAENVFKMLQLGSHAGGEHSRRSSLNRDNPPAAASSQQVQSANLDSAPNTSRRGSGGAEESKQDSARGALRSSGGSDAAGAGGNAPPGLARRGSQNEKRMSGGSLTRQLTGPKKNMIPLGRVGTLRALALQNEGGKESQRDSRIPSKPISRVNSKLSNGSSAGGPDEDPTANNQEIEGLEEFNAAHKMETAAATQKRLADGGGESPAPTDDGDGDAAVRAAIEAKRLEKKPVSQFGLKVLAAIDSGWGTLVMTSATIFCLFGDDIRVIGVQPFGDPVFWALSSLCFILFGLEFAAFCKWQEGYLLSFFFCLDLIATFSLIPDLPFIWDPFMESIGQGDAQKQNIAVARAGRASRAGTRAGRLVRFIRLVRFLRVSKLYKYCGETDEERTKREATERMEEADRLKREAEEKLISEMDSEIGKGFSDYITKCVIIMVLFLMFLLPLLEVTEVDTSAAFFVAEMDSIMQGAADALTAAAGGAAINVESTQIYGQAPSLILDLIHRFQDRFGSRTLHIHIRAPDANWVSTGLTHEVFYLYNDYDIEGLRTNEIEKDEGTWATVWISVKPDRQVSAIFNLCTTIFVTLLLAGGSALFSHDAHNMVILPIERMFLFVTRLAANPLGKIRPSGDADQPFETRLLESTFMKLAGLLQISFGAAGAEVISHNMHGDFLDPMVPGRKIFAIFGFCDIRKFGVVTEALGQHVMIFCIAEGTRVNMEGGVSKPIEAVVAGKDNVMALGIDEQSGQTGLVPRRVSRVTRVPFQRACVELRFSDGRTLICTPDHRIRTAEGQWMQAQKLVVGLTEVAASEESPERLRPDADSSLPPAGKMRPLSKVKLTGRRDVGLRTVYDLTVPAPRSKHNPSDDLHSFMASGIVVHNCNQIADIVHELTHMYGGAANKNIGNAFLLVWKPTVSQIRRVSNMNAALAGLPPGSGDLGNLLGKEKYTGPNTHTISEEDEDEEASTTNVKKAALKTAGSAAASKKEEQKEQWASRSPQKNGLPPPVSNGVEVAEAPIAAAEPSESSHARAARQPSETDQNNLNQPQTEPTTVPALSGSDSSSSLPALLAGSRGANRLTLPLNGSGAGLNVRGSVSVANAIASNATGIESSSAGVGHHSEYLSHENGVDAEFTTTKLDGEDADKKGPAATAEDSSPVHKQRRGSAHLIPTAIPEVSKSHQEHESQNAASHRDGPATTLPAHLKPPAASAGGDPSPRGSVARRESYLGAGPDTRQGPMWEAMKHLADQAMVAFLSTVREVAITQELAHWRANENMMKLLAAEPGKQYQVDMGFGLHVGWAIEGAIGSIYKIDASYLSPNVNIASRLCGATKQYGVRLLISGPLFSLMQPEIQKRCRHLDRITVKGSKLPLDVYTFDVGALALRPPGTAAPSPTHAASSSSASPVVIVTPASPVTAAAADSHAVVIPKSGAIPLGSLAARPAGSSIRGDADIEVDDQGNLVPQHLDPHREHAAAVEEQTEEFLAKQSRRGSRVMSNGKKVIDSITAAMGLKKEAAPAQDIVAPPATKPHGSKVQPEEMLPPAVQAASAASSPEHKGADATTAGAGAVEMANLRPVALHLGTPTSSNASADAASPSPDAAAALAALAGSSPSAPLGGSAVVLTSPPNSPPGKPKPKVDSGDFTPASLAAICAQLQLGLPDDFVRLFNEASSYYIAGKWGKARAILEGKILTVVPNDKPAKVLLSIMAEKDYHAPKDWPGFRALTSK